MVNEKGGRRQAICTCIGACMMKVRGLLAAVK